MLTTSLLLYLISVKHRVHFILEWVVLSTQVHFMRLSRILVLQSAQLLDPLECFWLQNLVVRNLVEAWELDLAPLLLYRFEHIWLTQIWVTHRVEWAVCVVFGLWVSWLLDFVASVHKISWALEGAHVLLQGCIIQSLRFIKVQLCHLFLIIHGWWISIEGKRILLLKVLLDRLSSVDLRI